MRPPENCPNCGADVPRHARACTECGADERTGWAEDADTSGLDLPGDSFDYDAFVKEEFGSSPRPSGINWFWWGVAVVLLLVFISMFIPH